jgi:Trypsin
MKRKFGSALALVVVSVALGVMAPSGGAIVDGTEIPSSALAQGGQYQWLALLVGNGEPKCTGSLIAAEWVLTAAHCLPITSAHFGANLDAVEVTASFQNPSFNGSADFDQALLHLAAPSTRTPTPLATSSDGLAVGSSMTVAGYGATSANGDMVLNPREAGVAVASLGANTISIEGLPTPCAGDSGGPWISGGVLVGVTSQGDVNCSQFTIASRVSGSLGWITSVLQPFDGFFHPVDNPPTLNPVKAGQAIAVKFSLHGDKGLAIFAAGHPKSQQIDCNSSSAVDGVEETITAGGSSLSYNALTDTYKYVWKTSRDWAPNCRQLVVKLAGGSVHRANFQFK